MTTVAYIANQFPAAVEPYVWDEVLELRRRGVEVICCSLNRAEPDKEMQKLAAETMCLLPIRPALLLPATALMLLKSGSLRTLFQRIFLEGEESSSRRTRALVHTWLGVYYALLLKDTGVQHIHAHHGYSASWIAMVAARVLGVGYSLTLHGSDLLVHQAYLDTKLDHCDFCFTVSQFNRRHIFQLYPEIAPDKVVVQRLGVDTSVPEFPVYAREDDAVFMMLAVGRLHRVKNHAFLIQGCRRLKDLGLRFFCLIVGEGPERMALERLILQLDLQYEVRLFGQVPRQRLDAYYSICDLVVLTSHSEGLPLVLMEAMAHGRTVLAPNITGIPELVLPGKTGFLYAPGSLDDFVAKVKVVSLARSALPPMRREARRYVVQHFNRTINLSAFAENFIARISCQPTEAPLHENSVLQQIQL